MVEKLDCSDSTTSTNSTGPASPVNTQRGVIASVWLYLAGAIAFMLVLAGLIKVWNSYTTALDKKGYDRGVAETTAAYTKRDNAQLQAALAAQTQAEARAAKAERDAATAQSTASANYQKGVNDGKAKLAAFIASARAGTVSLHDPGAKPGASPACGNQTGKAEVAGSATGSDGGATSGLLSESATVFLATEANRADEVVAQLTAAQAVIVSDRVLCNAP
jgi:prophage endopeptidase